MTLILIMFISYISSSSIFFFFSSRRRHTRSKRDWSSDVCSSDLNFRRFACDVAVVETRGYRREKLTYAELDGYARVWSAALGGRGIAPGDRVLLWGRNSAEWVACFWGILLRGAIVVPMDPTASPDFVGRAIQDASVKLIVRDGQLADPVLAPPSLVINGRKD